MDWFELDEHMKIKCDCETLKFEEAFKKLSKAIEDFSKEYGKPFHEKYKEEKERIRKEKRVNEISSGYDKIMDFFKKEPTSFILKYQKDILDNKIVFIVHFSLPQSLQYFKKRLNIKDTSMLLTFDKEKFSHMKALKFALIKYEKFLIDGREKAILTIK